MTLGRGPLGESAVVIGGSIAGLLAACVLAERFEAVTVIERDTFPDQPTHRTGVPQSRHVHVLLAQGHRLLNGLFPGFAEELLGAGAEPMDAAADVAWLTPVGWACRFRSNLQSITCSRAMLEWHLRARVFQAPNIQALPGREVSDLTLDPGKQRVSGVKTRVRESAINAWIEEVVPADLVVDTSGRGSRVPQWLGELGYPIPADTVVTARLGYASRTYRRADETPADWKGVYIQTAPPDRLRGGTMLPLENGGWIVTLIGGGGDYPPTHEAGFLEFAASLPVPTISDTLAKCEATSGISGHRSTENRWRHYEQLSRAPRRLLVLGDAACALNPVYGQGMTVAGESALTLRRCLGAAGETGLDGLAASFQRELARANQIPWALATGEDYRFPQCTGPRPRRSVRWLHQYMDQLTALTTWNRAARLAFLEALSLTAPPAVLFRPAILSRVAAQVLRGYKPGVLSPCSPPRVE